MSDDVRDKAAEEHASTHLKFVGGKPLGICIDAFKAGWDACAKELAINVALDTEMYQRRTTERDSLLAENERLKAELDCAHETIGLKAKEWAHSFEQRDAWKSKCEWSEFNLGLQIIEIRKAKASRDAWKSEALKLAEALDLIENGPYGYCEDARAIVQPLLEDFARFREGME